jgi:hypothetical protein
MIQPWLIIKGHSFVSEEYNKTVKMKQNWLP